MSNEGTIKQIEMNIDEAKKLVSKGEALGKLTSNSNFKKVILDGYLKDEAVRLTHLKGDPSMQSPELQAAIIKDLDGIGSLLAYFRNLEHESYLAQKAIQDDEETIETLLAEEV